MRGNYTSITFPFNSHRWLSRTPLLRSYRNQHIYLHILSIQVLNSPNAPPHGARKSGILKDMDQPCGFRELRHTADWELEVWAPDLCGLFEQATLGMYALSGVGLQPGPRTTRNLEIFALDSESLLVKFLAEVLFLGEYDGLGFDRFEIHINSGCSKDGLSESRLNAQLHGAPIVRQTKEIKAVTYHNIAIQSNPRGLEVRIVFDV